MVIQVDGIYVGKQPYFIDLIGKIENPKFKHLDKKGKTNNTIFFETDAEDADMAKALVKKTIKADPQGAVMYFRVMEEGKTF